MDHSVVPGSWSVRVVSRTSSFRRNPLVINGNHLSSGDRTASFAGGNADALLRSYLIFVRDLRGQRREPSIELRTEDVHVIAAHLGVTDATVLGGLLDLMGATRAQRSAMLAMLAAGALTLVLSGSIVTSLSADGVSVEMGRLADAVHAAVNDASSGSAPLESTARIEDAAVIRPDALVAESAHETPRADVLRSARPASTLALAPIEATGAPRIDAPATEAFAQQTQAVADQPVSIGVDADGSLVASVAPPVPTPPADEQIATAELPDGTTVGVAAPPVPPSPPD